MSEETVFLSYVHEDAEDARLLMSDLKRAGVAVVDRSSLVKPGARAKAAVWTAINTTSCFLLCLSSREGLPPAYAMDELQTAITAKRTIVPVRLTRCDIPRIPLDDEGTIADLEPLDLYVDREAGVKRLLVAMRIPGPNLPIATQRTSVIIDGGIKVKGPMTMDGNELAVKVGENIEAEGPIGIGSHEPH